MAITFPLDMPTDYVKSAVLHQRHAVALERSSLSLLTDAQDWGGAAWELDVVLEPMTFAQKSAWDGFLTSLQGPKNKFRAYVPGQPAPLGLWNGTPLTAGAVTVSSTTFAVDGATPSQTGWAKAGDFFHIWNSGEPRLHVVMQDADSNGAGAVTLEVWPPARSAYADNTALVATTNTQGLFRLSTSTLPWSVTDAGLWQTAFSAVEAV